MPTCVAILPFESPITARPDWARRRATGIRLEDMRKQPLDPFTVSTASAIRSMAVQMVFSRIWADAFCRALTTGSPRNARQGPKGLRGSIRDTRAER